MAVPRPLNARSDRFVIRSPRAGVLRFAAVHSALAHDGIRHAHPGQTQIIFLVTGNFDLEVAGGERWRLAPGDRCVVPEGMEHVVHPLPGQARMRFLDLRVATRPDTSLSEYIARLPVGVSPGPEAALGELAERVAAEFGAAPKPPMAIVCAAVWSVLALYETTADSPEPEPEPSDARLRFADLLMRSHTTHPLGIEDLAARVNLSSSRLRQLMMEHFGATPLERYRRIRLEQALAYVETSTLTMKEIAHACGFRSANHFSRAFSAWAKRSPSEVRRRAQSNQSD